MKDKVNVVIVNKIAMNAVAVVMILYMCHSNVSKCVHALYRDNYLY